MLSRSPPSMEGFSLLSLPTLVLLLIFSALPHAVDQWALAVTCHATRQIGQCCLENWKPYLKRQRGTTFIGWAHFRQLGGISRRNVYDLAYVQDYNARYDTIHLRLEPIHLLWDLKIPKLVFWGMIRILDEIRQTDGERTVKNVAQDVFEAAIQTFRPRLLTGLLKRGEYYDPHWADNRATYFPISHEVFLHFWKQMLLIQPPLKRSRQCFKILVRHWSYHQGFSTENLHQDLISYLKILRDRETKLPITKVFELGEPMAPYEKI